VSVEQILPDSELHTELHTASEKPGIVPNHSVWRDVIEILLLIITIYTLVNLATSRAVVEGQSMQPNFYTGQLVIINRFAYFFSSPARGDVIVLHDPKDVTQDFIKRVVGLPGETVQIKEGRVYVNGTIIEEPYIQDFCRAGCDGTWQLKKDEYFVLGDNRNNSFDGHAFGALPRDLIVGQAWIRYWPPQDIGLIPHPTYGITGLYAPILPAPTQTSTPTPTPAVSATPDTTTRFPGL
jgi:signal peptidase I